ncbi:MAG: pyridoxal phosphate-dependent aminotransferase [Spirochaetota bacterium]
MPVANQIREASSSSSMIRKMFEEGIRLKKEFGEDNVFDFSLGNPDLEPPKRFHEVLVSLAQEDLPGTHGYMPNAGFTHVRDAIAKKVSREQGVPIDGSRIVMTVGAAGALNIVLKTILNPGDEVVISRPYFVEYGTYIANHGGKMVLVDTDQTFSLDVNAISAALTPKTAAVLINSPNNPTGRVYTADQIADLAAALRSHHEKTGRAVYLIADEPYRDIIYGGKKVASVMAAYEHSIVVTSFSKNLSLPGERIGYVAVAPVCDDGDAMMGGLILCNRTLGFVNAPALMQRVVAELTEETVDIGLYERRRNAFAKGLREAGLELVDPEGAFYIFCKAPGGDDLAFVKHLEKHLILGVPGTGFGGKGYIRLCYCVPDAVIERSIPAFKKAVSTYKF